MSAIAGMFRRDGAPVARRHLERMLDAMPRRGPDGCGIWCDGPIGLAYRKLASTPESLLEQGPLVGERFVLAADARLDNRGEVAARLGIGTDALAAQSDSQLIAQVFDARGQDGLHALVGDFALAVWDVPTRQLILTRDHMGVRPLVYYQTDRLVAFASDVRALLTLEALPRRVDEARVADLLLGSLEARDTTSTFFHGILKLAPAHTLRAGTDRLEVARYWSLDPGPELALGSADEYIEAFREQFSRAVRCRLRSARPPVAMLSGGMDSSAIVAFAREQRGETGRPLVDTLSAVSWQRPEHCEETRHIRAVQAQGGVRPHDLASCGLEPLLPSLGVLYDTSDDPFDFTINLVHCLYARAQLDGFNVVLDGVDGDLIASASTHIPLLLRRGQWADALRAARGYHGFYGEEYPVTRLWRAARYAVAPDWTRRLAQRVRGRLERRPSFGDSFVAPALAARVSLGDRLREHRRRAPITRPPSTHHAHVRSLERPFLSVAIDRYDRVAASCGIEPRHPFLDRHFAQFCVSLPWHQKFDDGLTKIGLRRATEGLLPEAVRARKNFESLGPQFTGALLRHFEPLVRHLFEGRLERLDGFVSMPNATRAYRQYRHTGTTDHECWEIWSVLSLGRWLDRLGVVDLGIQGTGAGTLTPLRAARHLR